MNYVRFFNNPLYNEGLLRNNNCFNSDQAENNYPLMNSYEREDDYYLELAIPGYNKDKINIEIKQNVLTISYKEEENKKTDKNTIISAKQQFSCRAFSRSLQLPKSINLDSIKANFEDGILKIFLPKNKETEMKQTRQIFIS